MDAGRRKQIHKRMIKIRGKLQRMIEEVEGGDADPRLGKIARKQRQPRRRWRRR